MRRKSGKWDLQYLRLCEFIEGPERIGQWRPFECRTVVLLRTGSQWWRGVKTCEVIRTTPLAFPLCGADVPPNYGFMKSSVADLRVPPLCVLQLAGMESGYACFCGNEVDLPDHHGGESPSMECNHVCFGDHTQPCGGDGWVIIFDSECLK
ncbi:hypothetical protein F2P81_026193 [Scophthalmus maximus]|uniref:WSC domain-containing protein n=1 Tax=Scophthalmus maximus TaxID=52904 RepID=A0A6A4RSG2_SCOMX|nr:hypothetical protein F2P81_026193 [Scophthalmus maximus]